jgi:HNH endonuclease
VRFGQGHHLRRGSRGGPTTLSNLALLCRRHHRAVHEEGFQADREPDGALRFRRPDVGWAIDVLHPLADPGLQAAVIARERS